MYRAIITAVSGEATHSRVIQTVKYHLLNHFAHSQLCAKVLIENDPGMLTEWKDIEKVSNYTVEPSESQGGDRLVVVDLADEPRVSPVPGTLDHYVFISSIFRKFPSPSEAKVIADLHKTSPKARISAFRLSRIVPSATGAGTYSAKPSYLDHIYSVASQFLPVRYREIQAAHLAQAIRLNYETCERMSTPLVPSNTRPLAYYKNPESRVEELTFEDCMKVIGLEDKI